VTTFLMLIMFMYILGLVNDNYRKAMEIKHREADIKKLGEAYTELLKRKSTCAD
jgi:hypothetical protein